MRSEYMRCANDGESADLHVRERVTPRQEAAISALLSQPNLTAAASACGISQRTLRRWMRNASFVRRYQCERGTMLVGIVDVLKKECLGAIRTLVTISNDGQSP